MSAPAKDRLAAVLSAATAGGAPSAQRSLPTESLRLEVRGVGPVDLPVTPRQAQELAAATRPAKYGQGTETLFDPLVRDTGEVPKSRVRVDRDHWDGALGPVLEGLRDDLGLPSGSRLRADFHSMLVYGPGQFFKPHLDSEKADRMVGSLVVTLPSQFRGGALVVEHGEHRATYRGSKAKLSCVAFYADCRHEIRPVTSGHRIVLTYDLVLRGEHAAVVVPPEPARGHAQVEALAACLAEHFSEAPAPRWRNDHRSSAPPTRLVYLLDHQYTQRSVAWSRLKGDDAARVALLLDAAAQVDCEVALALADIHETRECYDDSWEAYGGQWGGWYEDEEDESESDAGSGGDEGAIAEGELLDWDLSLGHWIDAAGGVAEPIGTRVHDDEVATSTPTSDFEAYESEYQPYMGNWGNTMDRWYRRAAVVIWPRRLDFAVRAEASPAWALGRLAPDGEPVSAEERCAMAVSLAPFWTNVAPKEPRRTTSRPCCGRRSSSTIPTWRRCCSSPTWSRTLRPTTLRVPWPSPTATARRGHGPGWRSGRASRRVGASATADVSAGCRRRRLPLPRRWSSRARRDGPWRRRCSVRCGRGPRRSSTGAGGWRRRVPGTERWPTWPVRWSACSRESSCWTTTQPPTR